MKRLTHRPIFNPAVFGFPTIFQGRGVTVTVTRNTDFYDVRIDGMNVAKIKFDDVSFAWRLAHGDLYDHDLVKEIGERIEAKYN